jgi:polysaccharide pyruvyl transferase WcaK-like protein
VIGARYHNIVAALKLSKPTISIGYSGKHDALMADMGLSEFSRSVRDLDVHDLITQFKELERRAPELRQDLLKRNVKKMHELDDQFAALSALLRRD